MSDSPVVAAGSDASPSLFRWREALAPLLHHLLFVLYSLSLAPLVISGLRGGGAEEASAVGWLLLGALALEIPALHVLLMAVARRLKVEGKAEGSSKSLSIAMAWFAHVLVVIILYMQALRAFGLDDPIEGGAWPAWGLPLLVIKELYVLSLLLSEEGREYGAGPFYTAQAVLLVFSGLVHTGFWGLFMDNPQFSGYSTALLVMEAVIAGIFFTIFYAAVQLPGLKYVAADAHGRLRRRWVIGLALAGFASIWPFLEHELDGRYSSWEAASEAPSEVRLLALQDRGLSRVPEGLGRFSELRELYLFRNELAALPAAIGGLQRLELLSLGYNQLAELPSEIGELRRLKALTIYANRLRSLPPSIRGLESLEEMDAGWNALTSVPAAIGELRRLRILKLSHNRLVALPAAIGRLESLRVLDLSHNQLTTLPEAIYALDLDELAVNENPLEEGVRARLKAELVDTKITF